MVSDRAVGDDIARGVSAMPANTILIDIDPDDCVDLLGSAPIGRLGVVVHGHPRAALPTLTSSPWSPSSRLRPWAPGVRDRWMKIVPTEVTGRAVSRHREPSPSGHVSYMPPD